MNIKTVNAKNLIVKSKLPASDYVINPYIGCTHKCQYCYASFMKRFTSHGEEWGNFVDIKEFPQMYIPKNISDKTILISSVTDPYQPIEKKYCVTRKILQKLIGTSCNLEILTKSHLVTRDIDLFLQFPSIRIGISMNTLNDSFRKDIEPFASSVTDRINTLRELHSARISTYLFISPIFPGITDVYPLIEALSPYVNEICFENLNLRGKQIDWVLDYIEQKYPTLLPLYKEIYLQKKLDYWDELEDSISSLDNKYKTKFTNYFYHNKIKKK